MRMQALPFRSRVLAVLTLLAALVGASISRAEQPSPPVDVEHLKTQLRRAVPTANVTPILTSNNSVILTGVVVRAEDVDTVIRVTNSIDGLNVINALRVGGVWDVQLDVTVAAIRRDTWSALVYDLLAPLAGQWKSHDRVRYTVLKTSQPVLDYIQSLQERKQARLLAQPKLTTQSSRPATFLVTGEQAVTEPAALGQVGVQFEEFGTRINFLPIVLGSGKIHLEVEHELSKLDAASGAVVSGETVPGRVVDRRNTTAQLESGETFVISGLNRPGRRWGEEALLIFVTAHLVEPSR
jgi:pilus assembly protein CpaC